MGGEGKGGLQMRLMVGDLELNLGVAMIAGSFCSRRKYLRMFTVHSKEDDLVGGRETDYID